MIAGWTIRGNSQKRHAFLFEGNQFRELQDFNGDFHTAIRSVTNDGSLMIGLAWSGAGYSRSEKVDWVRIVRWQNGRAEFLPGFGENATKYKWYPMKTSADGSVVAGYRWSGKSPYGRKNISAFRWEAGNVEIIGKAPGSPLYFMPNGISADGRVIVGPGTAESGRTACVWDREFGLRQLQVVLQQHGVKPIGWKLQHARAVSADGTHIVGQGINPQGNPEAFLVRLPRETFGDR